MKVYQNVGVTMLGIEVSILHRIDLIKNQYQIPIF